MRSVIRVFGVLFFGFTVLVGCGSEGDGPAGPEIRAADSAYSEDAPLFCFQFENLDRIQGFDPGAGDLDLLLDFFGEVEENSTNERIVELVTGIEEEMRPYADAVVASGGDEEAALESLGRDVQSVVVQRLALLSQDGPTVLTAIAGECLAFKTEDPEETEGDDGSADASDESGSDNSEGQPATTVVTADAQDTQTGGTVAQQLDVLATGQVAMTSATNQFSVNPNNPSVGLAEIFIDRVHAASALETAVAAAGQKLVVVDYRVQIPPDLVAAPMTTDFMQLVVDGITYGPNAPLNEFLQAGDTLNSLAVFAVPITVNQLQIEVGPPSASGQGLTAIYDVTLEPDLAATAHIEAQAAIGDAAIVAQAESVELVDGTGVIAPNVAQIGQGSGQMTLLNAESVHVFGNNVAGPLEKFIVVDLRFNLTDGVATNLNNSTYRLETEGEIYGPANAANQFVLEGESVEQQVVFRVPRTAVELTFRAGSLPGTEGGISSAWSIKLPEPDLTEAEEASPTTTTAVDAATTSDAQTSESADPGFKLYSDPNSPFTFQYPDSDEWFIVPMRLTGGSMVDPHTVSLRYLDNSFDAITIIANSERATPEAIARAQDVLAADQERALAGKGLQVEPVTVDGWSGVQATFERDGSIISIKYNIIADEWIYEFRATNPQNSPVDVMDTLQEVIASIQLED